jgi:predicted HAD superfamily Cof-like phosphohydrolase
MNGIARTKLWMETALPFPKTKNLHTQLGVHFEEVLEMLEALNTYDAPTKHLIVDAVDALNNLQNHLKKSDGIIELHGKNRVHLLDALCDQIVTSVGVAHTYGMNIVGALEEVNDSNFSKFLKGKPLFDENKKIVKGPHYRPANLYPFV